MALYSVKCPLRNTLCIDTDILRVILDSFAISGLGCAQVLSWDLCMLYPDLDYPFKSVPTASLWAEYHRQFHVLPGAQSAKTEGGNPMESGEQAVLNESNYLQREWDKICKVCNLVSDNVNSIIFCAKDDIASIFPVAAG